MLISLCPVQTWQLQSIPVRGMMRFEGNKVGACGSPPQGVNLNSYYGVGDQIIVVTTEAGAVFVHGQTGTLYFYHEEGEGFVNAFGEAYIGFWGGSSGNSASTSCRFFDLPGRCTRSMMVPHCSSGTGGSIGASYARVGVSTSARTLPADAGS